MSGSGGPGTSNRWSCATLGDGLEHVRASLGDDDDGLFEEEARLLAELQDHTNLLFENDVKCLPIYYILCLVLVIEFVNLSF